MLSDLLSVYSINRFSHNGCAVVFVAEKRTVAGTGVVKPVLAVTACNHHCRFNDRLTADRDFPNVRDDRMRKVIFVITVCRAQYDAHWQPSQMPVTNQYILCASEYLTTSDIHTRF